MNNLRKFILFCYLVPAYIFTSDNHDVTFNRLKKFIPQGIGRGGNPECCATGQGIGVCLIAGMPTLATPINLNYLTAGAAATNLVIPPFVPAALGCCIITKAGMRYYVTPEEEKKKSSACKKTACCLLGVCFPLSQTQLCGPQCTTAVYCYDAMVR